MSQESIFFVNPNKSENVKLLSIKLLEKNNLINVDIKNFIESAIAVKRWDFNTWTLSYIFFNTEKSFFRLYITADDAEDQVCNFIYKKNEHMTTTFSTKNNWALVNNDRDISDKNFFTNNKEIIFYFDNPRIWDSFYFLCSVCKYIDLTNLCMFNYYTNKVKSLLSPAILPEASNIARIEKEKKDTIFSHVIKTPLVVLDDKTLLEIAEKLFKPSCAKKHHLLISFEAEKRVCVNQVMCFSLFINKLKEIGYEPEIIFLNGMTAPVAGRTYCDFKEQQKIEEGLLAELKKASNVKSKFVNLFGKTFVEKLNFVKQCFFYISPSGSASIIPNILKIPGVVFNNKESVNWRPGLGIFSKVFPSEYIYNDTSIKGVYHYAWSTKEQCTSYSLDEEKFISVCTSHFNKFVAITKQPPPA